MDFRNQRPLLGDQRMLACEILRRPSLLPEGVDLAELGFQGIKALMERCMRRMQGVIHPCSSSSASFDSSRFPLPFAQVIPQTPLTSKGYHRKRLLSAGDLLVNLSGGINKGT